jgi:hypothetical protein
VIGCWVIDTIALLARTKVVGWEVSSGEVIVFVVQFEFLVKEAGKKTTKLT